MELYDRLPLELYDRLPVELYDRLPDDFVVVMLRLPVVSRLTALPLLPEDLRLPCDVTVLFLLVVLTVLSVLT